LSFDQQGTEESVAAITLDDLKNYYDTYFSPSTARFIVAGDLNKERVVTALATLTQTLGEKRCCNAHPSRKVIAPRNR
jgi:zinc protease